MTTALVVFVAGRAALCVRSLARCRPPSRMMMTGRVYNAAEGERAGFAQYLVPGGHAFDKAFELAQHIAGNAPLTNYALLHALPRIADQSQPDGLFTESLMAAVAESTPDAQSRLKDFLEKRAAKVVNS